MHGHTRWSGDCRLDLPELERAAARAGLDAVCITDHNEVAGAQALAARGHLRVVVGEEVRTSEGEIIGLFLAERIPPRLSPAETVAAIKAQGGLVYLPHPRDRFRGSRLSAAALEAILPAVDILEVFNARNLLAGDNVRARALARRHGLRMGAGSDFHTAGEVGRAYLDLPEFRTPAELLGLLPAAAVRGRRSGPLPHLQTKLVKELAKRGR